MLSIPILFAVCNIFKQVEQVGELILQNVLHDIYIYFCLFPKGHIMLSASLGSGDNSSGRIVHQVWIQF